MTLLLIIWVIHKFFIKIYIISNGIMLIFGKIWQATPFFHQQKCWLIMFSKRSWSHKLSNCFTFCSKVYLSNFEKRAWPSAHLFFSRSSDYKQICFLIQGVNFLAKSQLPFQYSWPSSVRFIDFLYLSIKLFQIHFRV